MTDRPLTLMAVHAHPDDEATGTGGVLAQYAAEGIPHGSRRAPTAVAVRTGVKLGDPGTIRRRSP